MWPHLIAEGRFMHSMPAIFGCCTRVKCQNSQSFDIGVPRFGCLGVQKAVHPVSADDIFYQPAFHSLIIVHINNFEVDLSLSLLHTPAVSSFRTSFQTSTSLSLLMASGAGKRNRGDTESSKAPDPKRVHGAEGQEVGGVIERTQELSVTSSSGIATVTNQVEVDGVVYSFDAFNQLLDELPRDGAYDKLRQIASRYAELSESVDTFALTIQQMAV